MKKDKLMVFVFAVVVVFGLGFTFIGNPFEKKIEIINNENPVMLKELKLPSELNRDSVIFHSFNGRYGVFSINRQRDRNVIGAPADETAEIVVYDTVKEQVVMYRNVDLTEAWVEDAIYYNNVLYYSVEYYEDKTEKVFKTDGLKTEEVYSVESDYEKTGIADLGLYNDYPYFVAMEKAEDIYHTYIYLLKEDEIQKIYGKTSSVNDEPVPTFIHNIQIGEKLDSRDEVDLYNICYDEKIENWLERWGVQGEHKYGVNRENLREFGSIGDYMFTYGDDDAGSPLFEAHNVAEKLSRDIGYMSMDGFKTDGSNAGVFLHRYADDRWRFNLVTVDGLKVYITPMETDVDVSYYDTHWQVGDGNRLFFVNRDDKTMLLYEKQV